MLRWAVALLLAALLLGATSAGAEGGVPRLAVSKFDADAERFSDLLTVTPGGRGQRSLLAGRPGLRHGLGSSAAWSPDGASLAFSSRQHIWVVGADGRGVRRLPGSRGGFAPVFSPDGQVLAFARSKRIRSGGDASPFESTAVWTLNLETGAQHRLTRLDNGLEQFPTSFSPDGSTLLVTRFSFNRSLDFELVAIRFDGRTSALLVGSGGWGRYSPDGKRILFMRERNSWDLYTVDARGGDLRRLTNTARVQEVEPSWDPSGRRIAFVAATFDRRGGVATAAAWQANRDGSCPRQLLSAPDALFFGPVWQPGPGRGAGPLSC